MGRLHDLHQRKRSLPRRTAGTNADERQTIKIFSQNSHQELDLPSANDDALLRIDREIFLIPQDAAKIDAVFYGCFFKILETCLTN
jgi:hypothetical protein